MKFSHVVVAECIVRNFQIRGCWWVVVVVVIQGCKKEAIAVIFHVGGLPVRLRLLVVGPVEPDQ